MSDDELIRPRWQRLLLDRFVLTPLAIVLMAAEWHFYASAHHDGFVKGRVVDASGESVVCADVTPWTFNFTTFKETSHTTSGGGGAYTFVGNPSHNIRISARKPGVGSSARVPVRPYFRLQDIVVRSRWCFWPVSPVCAGSSGHQGNRRSW